MKIISSIINAHRASVVAIDGDYVYVVDATPAWGSRWTVHLVISLGDDVVYDNATHDRVTYGLCPDFSQSIQRMWRDNHAMSFWATYMADQAHVHAYI